MSEHEKAPQPLADDASFETVVERLEKIVGELEQGTLPLEQSLKVFEEGVALARRASQSLDSMERRIEVLTEDNRREPLPESNHADDEREG